MSTITIYGSYGELVVRVCDGAILDRSNAGPEYADIVRFFDLPDHDAQLIDLSYVTNMGLLCVPDEATA
ncbi:hypothetical protein UFOVP4_39 [uncultured Caudovirales phage]|uniref:Uncharacterized protein n=1 Tax=uncultured Caudovirales phage TaxID=2100421 RepID=A0A6J7VJF0_9CAUD|nr:hypothetical protein UFOVP4_39 [uncultured Caudovirales phage]CAB4241263.1 hypothetical protein UFOVP64_21 [uncultured Caudovirales phage]CAB5078994.1 hypothetical protein UFOVP145_35 [uncultured Caudovirales phage]